MAAIIQGISFTNEFRGETTNFLIGSIGDKIIANITVMASWFLQASADQTFFFPTDKYIAIRDADGDRIENAWTNAGFHIGDTVTITGTVSNNGNYIITGFAQNGADALFSATTFVSETATAGRITGTTPITGINFRYNLIENSSLESYLSLVDLNELRFAKGGLSSANTSFQTALQQGVYKSNHQGSVRIRGNTTLNQFIIEHTFYITPLFRSNDLILLEQNEAPDYFYTPNCLAYIFKTDLLFSLQDPNKLHASDDSMFKIGNTGWFNENFNGDVNFYTIDPTTFTVGGQSSTYADFTGITDFTINIYNTTDAPFSNNNTKFCLHHFFLPENEPDYINTQTGLETNFMFDRAFNTVGSAAVNGMGNGTAKQVLTDVAATFISTSHIRVTGKINLSAANKNKMGLAVDKQFCLFVTTQNHTLATELADHVALFAGISTYNTDLSNPDAGTVNVDFFYHPQTNFNTPNQFPGWFVEDGVIARSSISVDTENDATIARISAVITAEHATHGSFELERQDFSFANGIVVNGVQQINVTQSRGFILKSGNPFNIISLQRDAAKDVGFNKFYEFLYPFKIRWEEFIQLPGVSSQFYDAAQDFNGFNENWNRYFVGTGWELKYKTEALIQEQGVTNEITGESQLFAYNYGDGTDWSTTIIKTFENSTSTEITPFLSVASENLVFAEFTKLATPYPLITEVEGQIEIEVYREGGSSEIQMISTVWEHQSGCIFKSLLGNLLLKKEIIGTNVYRFSTLVDHTKLDPAIVQWKLSARIYPVPSGLPTPCEVKLSKLTSPDGSCKTTSPDGIVKTPSPS